MYPSVLSACKYSILDYDADNDEYVFQQAFHTNSQTIKKESEDEEEELEECEIIDEGYFKSTKKRSL